MPTNASEFLDLVIIVSVFALVLAVWLMIVAAWSGRRLSVIRRMQERLGLKSKGNKAEDGRVLRLWKDGKETTTTVGGTQTPSIHARLEDLRLTAGWGMPLRTIFLAIFGLSLLVMVTALVFTHSALLGGGMSLIVPAGFWALTQMRIKRRNIKLEGQFVEALELAARSLKAGHPLVGSFRLIGEEMSPPVSLIFAEICQLQEYGASLKEAIHKTTSKAGSADMKLFATSVAIQLDSGGNLAEMMQRLAHVIRDRIRLRRRVGILTAQTQLSKRVLIALPFVLLAGLTFLNAEYMSPLFTTTVGHYMLMAACAGMVMGIWMMNRVSQLQY
jgi:tight adherence protein B